jgi:hypothetical protein
MTEKNGNTLEQVLRFVGKDTMEWTSVRRDAIGEIIFDVEGKGERKSSLPSFQARGAKAENVPAEMKPLQRMIGAWHDEIVTKVAEGSSVETSTSYTSRISPILGGHFVRHEAADNDGNVVYIAILTFDPKQEVYRQWNFRSNGPVSESRGQWGAATDTLTLTHEGQEITGRRTIHFLDEETKEWSLVYRDPQGKIHVHIDGKSTRQK